MGLVDIHRRGGEQGFVTRAEIDRAEVASSTFTGHARRLGWDPKFWRVWVPTGRALSHLELCLAAVASIGGDAIVTGASALVIDQVLTEPRPTAELLLPARRHVAARDDVCIHRTTNFSDVRTHHGSNLQLASVARAFADHAWHSTVDDLCRDIATAVRLRRCSLPGIGRELSQRKRFPGRANLRTAHGLLTGELTHSDSERVARTKLRAAGLAFHSRPLAVEDGGRLIAEIDIPFAEIMYGVEVDGPHHLFPDQAAADRARDRVLESLGWTIDRFFWFEVEQRATQFVAQVLRRVEQLSS